MTIEELIIELQKLHYAHGNLTVELGAGRRDIPSSKACRMRWNIDADDIWVDRDRYSVQDSGLSIVRIGELNFDEPSRSNQPRN